MSDNNRLIPDDDYEYEKKLAEQEQKRRELEKAKEEAELERQKQLQKQRDKRIQAEKIELIKLKNGVIDESDSIREEHEEKVTLHGKEKLANIWYHNKYIILFIAFLILAVGYITYKTVSKVSPDLTVMMVANNGLSYNRQEELQDFFAKYTDDVNGDGKVKVNVIIAPLDDKSNDTSYWNKFIATLQTDDCMLFITDSNSPDKVKEVMDNSLPEKFKDNKYITEQGFSLNMKLFAEKIKFENMPNDVVLSIRQPTETMNTSLEDMERSYNRNFKILSKIVDDLTAQAEKTNDPGLTTEPLQNKSSSDTDSTK